MTGNFDPENFLFEDIAAAVDTTTVLNEPVPPHLAQDTLMNIVGLIAKANPDKAEGFGGAIAWGITIGVIAERNRIERIK